MINANTGSCILQVRKKHTHQTHQQQTPKSEVKMKIIWLNAQNITIEWKKKWKNNLANKIALFMRTIRRCVELQMRKWNELKWENGCDINCLLLFNLREYGHADERKMCFNLDNKLYNSSAIQRKRYRVSRNLITFYFWKNKIKKKQTVNEKLKEMIISE